MSQQTPYFPLGGGLDLITPAIAHKPGSAIGGLNYEPVPNGYRRVEGFERFDGRTGPTAAPYWMLTFTAGIAAFALGDTVTGATSGATGKVLAAPTITSGDYGTSNAAGRMGLGRVIGTFVAGESLQVSGDTRAVASGAAVLNGSVTDAEALAWQKQATADQRALIQAVPGSGPVRGVWAYNGDRYAFRDNAGATAGGMWKATAAGWVAVSLGHQIDFTSGGEAEILEGNTITGATSGATATVMRVVVQSGDWAAGTAAGFLILSGGSGSFVAENLNAGGSLNIATVAGDKQAITLPAGGRYEFTNHNFYGASVLRRMYGCNGVGRAFEFDGTTFTPIRTGAANDKPTRVAVHKMHLVLALPGGELNGSAPGLPLTYDAVQGAWSAGVGSEITDLIAANSGILTVLAEHSVSNLYGSSSDDFQLEVISDEAGALPWTADKVGEPIYMDKRGVRSLSSTQAFGNFAIGTLTQKVKPLLQDYFKAGVNPVASVRVRNKDQYRIFFSNQAGLTIYMGKKEPEILPFNLGKTVTCICSVEGSDGEAIYFGSDDGFVYQLDKGVSFDGEPISFALRLPFIHQGAPQQLKRYHKAVVECEAAPSATIYVSADFDYGDPFQAGVAPVAAPAQVFNVTGGGGIWDVSNWDQFYWSGATEGLMEAHLDGVGRNMSLLIAGETADEPPHLLQGITLYLTARGLQR